MQQLKKKRGENWGCDEKEILRQIIAESAHVVEDKSTRTSVNIQKLKEWKNIQVKFNELTGKCRSDAELKLAWKRMKLSAKANLSKHRREQTMTGGGEKPPSPLPEDLAVMAIAPHDFVIEVNDYDSDALDPVPVPCEIETAPLPIEETKEIPEQEVVYLQDTTDITNSHTNERAQVTRSTSKKKKKSLQNRSDEMRQTIVQSNSDLKKRQLEMMEVEHYYNIEIAKFKIKKLKLEISLLENKNQTNTDE